MKKIIAIILAFGLSGCPFDPDAVLSNPQPSDLEGDWESTSVLQLAPYVLVKFYADGSGLVVVSAAGETGVLGTLSKFESSDKAFNIVFSSLEDSEEPETLEGTIQYGQLCLSDLEEDSPVFCFTRSSELKKFQKEAQAVILAREAG